MRERERDYIKVFSTKFPEYYPDQQAPEEGRRAQRQKRCNSYNKDEVISLISNNIILYVCKREKSRTF